MTNTITGIPNRLKTTFPMAWTLAVRFTVSVCGSGHSNTDVGRLDQLRRVRRVAAHDETKIAMINKHISDTKMSEPPSFAIRESAHVTPVFRQTETLTGAARPTAHCRSVGDVVTPSAPSIVTRLSTVDAPDRDRMMKYQGAPYRRRLVLFRTALYRHDCERRCARYQLTRAGDARFGGRTV